MGQTDQQQSTKHYTAYTNGWTQHMDELATSAVLLLLKNTGKV